MLIDEKTTKASDIASNEETFPPSHEAVFDPTVGPLGEGSSPPAYSQAVGHGTKPTPPPIEKWRPRHNDPAWSGDQDGDYSNIPPGSPSTSTHPIPPVGNLIHVYKRDGRITGEWNINPSLEVPAAFLPPPKEDNEKGKKKQWWNFEPTIGTDENGNQANLSLHTRDGRIVADVWVSDSSDVDNEKDQKKPTLLDLNTRDGTIQLRVRTHGSRPLRIRCHTNDGRIWVFLPRSFQGLLLHKIHDGKLNFSEGLKPHATTFSLVQGKVGTSFVGNWREALQGGEAGIGAWEGDRCEVTTKDGSIFFYWDDEYEEIMQRRKSNWFKNMFQID